MLLPIASSLAVNFYYNYFNEMYYNYLTQYSGNSSYTQVYNCFNFNKPKNLQKIGFIS